jgi:PAS domain-containing protein
MKIPDARWPQRLMRAIRRTLDTRRKGRRTVTHETWKVDDIKDIDHVVETFNGLVAQLCRDGSQLGELYVRAEQRAAKYALLSETVIDSLTSGILVLEGTGEITLANSAARGILGFDASEDITGRRLSEILADSQELDDLASRSFRSSANASRQILSVRTRTGRKACLGASTSCVVSSPSKTDLVIVVFTELAGRERPGEGQMAAGSGEKADQGYLRGVLDCYDHFSALAGEVEGLRAKSDAGALRPVDVADCAAAVGRAWEVMTAFALSFVARESLTELADLGAIVKSVLGRRKEYSAIRLVSASDALPQVKTVRKALEAGLDLLLQGCLADAGRGLTLAVTQVRGIGGDALEIALVEQAPRSQIAAVGDSLRDFRTDLDLRREAGLMLLKSLPADGHRVTASQAGEALVFKVLFLATSGDMAGPAQPRGTVAESAADEI